MVPAPAAVTSGRVKVRSGAASPAGLVPDLEEAVPGSCCYCHAVLCHAQTAYAVVVAS